MALPLSFADGQPPWKIISDINGNLFDASTLFDATSSAKDHLYKSKADYESSFFPDKELDGKILKSFDALEFALDRDDSMSFSYNRMLIKTYLLAHGYNSLREAIEKNDTRAIDSWVLVREFGPSTKFSHPGVLATSAIEKWKLGAISKEEFLSEIDFDYLDTYQLLFMLSLDDASERMESGFLEAAFEKIGSATGYWNILRKSYIPLYGEKSTSEIDSLLWQLTVGLDKNPSGLYGKIDVLKMKLQGFRAAPLTLDQQKQRATRAIRFLSLVPVEYSRGVKNNEVVLEIELQEAATFLEGSKIAFSDLGYLLDSDKVLQLQKVYDSLQEDVSLALRKEYVASSFEIQQKTDSLKKEIEKIFPKDWQDEMGSGDFDIVESSLDKMLSFYASAKKEEVKLSHLEAYAFFDQTLEKKLLAFNPDLAKEIEGLFWYGGSDRDGLAELIANNAPAKDIRSSVRYLKSKLHDADIYLSSSNSKGSVVLNSAIIVFREGLEAILILYAVTFGMLRNDRKSAKPIGYGVIAALVATLLFWFLSSFLLDTFSRYGEKLEAVVSIVAVLVLLVIMNWFLKDIYWDKWISMHHKMREKSLVNKETVAGFIGLCAIGFTSVFREGFETVLFLQVLILDAGLKLVLQGVLIGALGLALVGFITFILEKRLPYFKMLLFTGGLIALVLVTITGQTIRTMQSVGWMSVHPISFLDIPFWAGMWLGVHATWEGILGQFFAIILLSGSYIAARFIRQKKEALRNPKEL